MPKITAKRYSIHNASVNLNHRKDSAARTQIIMTVFLLPILSPRPPMAILPPALTTPIIDKTRAAIVAENPMSVT
jgi:hypothetical protein